MPQGTLSLNQFVWEVLIVVFFMWTLLMVARLLLGKTIGFAEKVGNVLDE